VKQQAQPKNTKSSKYDEFMQFMEDIEEEMSSQYEKSSQRVRPNRLED